jgi:hypothetical protein
MIIPGYSIALIVIAALAFLLAWLFTNSKLFTRYEARNPSTRKFNILSIKMTGIVCLILSVWEIFQANN